MSLEQYVNSDTVAMFSDADQFRSPMFCCDPISECDDETYEDWVNSATYTFNLHFMQEPKCIAALRDLIRRDGTINFVRAQKLFLWTGIPVTHDCEGLVYVREIVDMFLAELNE